MRHLAAYLMLVLGGNEKPTVDYSFSSTYSQSENIMSVLEAVGSKTQYEQIEKLLADLECKNIEEMIN